MRQTWFVPIADVITYKNFIVKVIVNNQGESDPSALNTVVSDREECNTTNNIAVTRTLLDIPRDGLVAFYPFSGNAKDASGNNLHGVVNGALLTTDRFGNTDAAYAFNGTSDFINVGNPSALRITNTITLAMWVKKDAFSESAPILSKKQATNITPVLGEGFSVLLNTIGSGEKYYWINSLYPGTGIQGNNNAYGADFEPGVWQFLAIVMDGQKLTWYNNGVLSITVDNNQPLTANSLGDFLIGRDIGVSSSFPTSSFDGKIDDVVVYNRALSEREIKQIYNQTVSTIR
jgi:Concanavalin A-like lectin/glucanases superfamily